MNRKQQNEWKDHLKRQLENFEMDFSLEELQKIIDKEFFDDNNPMDSELIDAACRRIALIKGVSPEKQYELTAYAALWRVLDIEK